jgi:prolyl-tRNA synthetase
MNEIKVGKVPGLDNGFRFATVAEIDAHFGTKPGYLGPMPEAAGEGGGRPRSGVMADWICGANEVDFHLTGVNWGRDLPEPDLVADLRNVVAGDPSPDGKGRWPSSAASKSATSSCSAPSTAADERHLPRRRRQAASFEMGCYGIGVTRLPAAAIEQNHDERGIIWPDASRRSRWWSARSAWTAAPKSRPPPRSCTTNCGAGVDVMLDDRGERPGAMFADWELIGVPHRVVISDRGLKEGQLEYQHRRDTAATKVPATGADLHRAFVKVRPSCRRDQAAARAACTRRLPARCGAGFAAAHRLRRRPARGAADRLGAHRAQLGHRTTARRRSPSSPNTEARWPTCAGWAK